MGSCKEGCHRPLRERFRLSQGRPGGRSLTLLGSVDSISSGIRVDRGPGHRDLGPLLCGRHSPAAEAASYSSTRAGAETIRTLGDMSFPDAVLSTDRSSAARAPRERVARTANRAKSNTTEDNVQKQCLTARKINGAAMNAQNHTLQHATRTRFRLGRSF